MSIVYAVQVLVILSFIFALRMKIWRTSLNSFVFINGLFILTITREIDFFVEIWTKWHVSIVGLTLLFVMSRVAYQSFYKKYKDLLCNDCTNYNRRITDKK